MSACKVIRQGCEQTVVLRAFFRQTAAEISKNDDEALKNSVGAPKTGEKGNSESENEEKSLCIVEGEERGVPRRQKRETSPSSSESKVVFFDVFETISSLNG